VLKYGLAVLLLTTAAGTAGAQSDPVPSEEDTRPVRVATVPASAANPRPPIRNRVLDLLDREIVLDAASGRTSWRSEPFDTAAFNRVGIRVTAREGNAPLTCSLWWQFARDDAFLPGPPTVAPRWIGDDRRLVPVLNPIAFSDMFGLRARAVCELVPVPDPGGSDPPPPPSATLTDLKVLLRLE